MAEYIDRGIAIAKLTALEVTERNATMTSAKRLLAYMPAADVAPVRHGRWEEADWVEPDCHGFGTIITPKAALRCSNCKNCFKKELLWKDNYCPNCGTDMRGRNDE